MRQSFKSILRFLFPELQIIDAVKQDGFIAKKSSVKNMHRQTTLLPVML